MQAPIEIQKLLNRKGHKNREVILFYNLMVGLNQPYSSILEMPIPMALKLNDQLIEEQKKQDKEMKKKR